MKLGCQTYTIRSLAQKKLEVALNLLKHKGITKVELARIDLTNAHAKLLNAHDFEVLSIQATYHKLNHKFKSIISFCELTKCQRVVVSVLPLYAILGGKKSILKFSKRLNALCNKYALYNIEVGFHHHAYEFKKIKGTTKLDLIKEFTQPQVMFVTDTYWAYSKHIEPDLLITSFGKRLMGIHLRDYKELKHKKHQDTEVGYGLINFHKVINAAKVYAPYLVIEQNSKTPFQSIDKSRKWLYENFNQDIKT